MPPKVSFVKHPSPNNSHTPKADRATMDLLYGANPDVTGSQLTGPGAYAQGADQAVGADNQVFTTDFKSDHDVVNLNTPARD
jgi:hypothetical protein